MDDLTGIQIPKPTDDKRFERQIRDLFEILLKDPSTQMNGRSGQPQAGVDIWGIRSLEAQDKEHQWVGIQCKLTTKNKLPKNTVTSEANAALSFQPNLKEYFIVTTAEDSVDAQEEARLFTEQQKKEGRDFKVNVWGWETILIHAEKDVRTRQIFFTDASPITNAISNKVDQVIAVQQTDNIQRQIDSEKLDEILRLLSQPDVRDVSIEIAKDTSSLDSSLDREIDGYRDLIQERPYTALELLTKLSNNLPLDVTPHILYRVKANIAACNLQIGNESIAAEGFMEAYTIAPDKIKADTFKVMGLTLNGNPQEAIDFGLQNLKITQNKIALVTAIIETKKHLPKKENPFDIITPDIENEKDVLIAKIAYHRHFMEREKCHEVASIAYHLFPEDETIQRYFFEAHLDEILGNTQINGYPKERLISISENLEKIWNNKMKSEVKWDSLHLNLATNLAICHRLLENYDRATSILNEAHHAAPDDQYINEIRYIIAIESGDDKTADELFDKLPVSRNTVLGRLQLLTNNKKWEMVLGLPPIYTVPDLTASDKAYYDALSSTAHWHLDKKIDPKIVYNQLKEKHPHEPIVEISFYKIAEEKKDRIWSQELYQEAMQGYKSHSLQQKIMLSLIADKQSHHDGVIDLLEDIIDLSTDNDQLRLLAAAYVNARIRTSAIQFADNMNDNLLEIPYYNRIRGNIYFNYGDLKKSETCLRKALQQEPNKASTHIALIQSLLRQDKKEEIKNHLPSINIHTLDGNSEEKMGIAQILNNYGETELGREFGYQVALVNQDNPRVLLLYMGLFLPQQDTNNYLDIDTVITDCSIELQNEQGKIIKVVLENGDNRPSFNHFSHQHEPFGDFIGKPVGTQITHQPEYGTPQTWSLLSIKHKYIAMLHEILETFQTKFAGYGGFYTYHTKDGDVGPILNDIKDFSTKRQEQSQLYENNIFPIGLMINLFGGNIIGFHQTVRHKGGNIKTCLGSNEERSDALKTCVENIGREVVLDTYTTWVSIKLKLVPLLKNIFKSLIVPQSCLDEFYKIREELEGYLLSGSYMTVRYEDGQFIREESTKEQIQSNIDNINHIIKVINENFDIVPAAPVESLNQAQEKLLEMASHSFLDSCYVATSRGAILLSDDLGYRAIAFDNYKIKSVWLQIVALVAEDRKQINFSEYSKIVSDLALMGHAFLTMNSRVLFEICLNDEDDLRLFSHIATYIGGKDAEYSSNLRVIMEFILKIWRMNIPDLRKKKACGIMLDRMNILTSRHNLRNDMFMLLLKIAKPYHMELHNYILNWLQGHFIHISE